jgi:hypothetical protein
VAVAVKEDIVLPNVPILDQEQKEVLVKLALGSSAPDMSFFGSLVPANTAPNTGKYKCV